MDYIISGILCAALGFVVAAVGMTATTQLEDYELAIGVCIENSGVDYMVIKTGQFESVDYLQTVKCLNGAEFALNSPLD